MNESEFEQQLRALRPARPSRELEGKIGRELAPVASPRMWSAPEVRSWLERLLPAFGWGSLGAAAAVVVMLSLNLAKGGSPAVTPSAEVGGAMTQATPIPNPAPPGQPGQPVMPSANAAVSGALLEANNEGLLEGGDLGVARRVRYSLLERRSWQDASGAVTVVEVPREDVVVVPVSFQ